MAGGFQYEREDPQQHGGDAHLPGQHVERRHAPGVAAGMQDGEGPGEPRGQQPAMSQHHPAVAPVEAQRIDQHEDAGDPEGGAGEGTAADLFADHPGHRHHPEHGRVGQHAGAAGRYGLHAEIGEGEEAGELQPADRQDDRPVGATGPGESLQRRHQDEGGRRRQGGARRRQPDRRAGAEADPDHRPGQAEQHDDEAELQPRHARGPRVGHRRFLLPSFRSGVPRRAFPGRR